MFAVLADVILSVVDIMIGTYDVRRGNGLLSGLFGLGILVPGLALGARRLHDINKSGWWQLNLFCLVCFDCPSDSFALVGSQAKR